MVMATATVVTPAVAIAVVAAAFMIGLAKGGLSGLGTGVTLVVALAVPAAVALGLVLPFLMVGDVVALWALRGDLRLDVVKPILPGALVGVVAASSVLSRLSAQGVEVALIVVVVVFVTYRVAVLTGAIKATSSAVLATPRAGAAAGVAAGVTSTLAHAGGPPVAVHLLSRDLRPVEFAGASAAVFFVINWLKVPGYVAAGLFDVDLLIALAPAALAIVPGVLVGRWAVRRIPARPFEWLVLAGLMAGVITMVVT